MTFIDLIKRPVVGNLKKKLTTDPSTPSEFFFRSKSVADGSQVEDFIKQHRLKEPLTIELIDELVDKLYRYLASLTDSRMPDYCPVETERVAFSLDQVLKETDILIQASPKPRWRSESEYSDNDSHKEAMMRL